MKFKQIAAIAEIFAVFKKIWCIVKLTEQVCIVLNLNVILKLFKLGTRKQAYETYTTLLYVNDDVSMQWM